MLAATIEDLTGSMEVIVFPRTYDETGSHWVDEAPVVITGKVDFRDEVAQLLCETVQPLEEMVQRREPLRLEIELRPSGNEQADVSCLERVIAALHSYRGNDRFNLRLGGQRLNSHPGATTWWNPKLDKLLEGLLGPNRVRVLPASQAAAPIDEYVGPLSDPRYEAALAG